MLKKFEYFLTVAKYENITRAAEELYLTQPALSSAISKFEKELGVELFERHGHSISLSAAGRHAIPFIEKICTNYEVLLNELETVQTTSTHSIRLGTGIRHVVNIADSYMNYRQGTDMLISQYYNYYELKKSLLNQQVDVCVCSPAVSGWGIKTRDICIEPLCVVCSERHPFSKRESVSLEEIAREDMLGLPDKFPTRIVIDDIFKKANLRPRYIIEAENNAIMHLLNKSEGKNYMIIYPISRARELINIFSNIFFTPISDDGCVRVISASWLENRPPTPEIEDMLDYFGEFYKSDAYLNPRAGMFTGGLLLPEV